MFLISLVMVLGLGSIALAADYDYTGDYPFSYLYISPWNWDPEPPYGGPGSGDTAYIKSPGGIIVLDTDITVGRIRGPAWESEGAEGDQTMLLLEDCNLFVEDRWEVEKTMDEDACSPDTAYILMSDDAKVYIDGQFRSHDDGGNQRTVIHMEDNAVFETDDDVRVGDWDDDEDWPGADYFELVMTDDTYFYAGNNDDGFRQNWGDASIHLSGNAILECELWRFRGRSPGETITVDITENSQFIVNDHDDWSVRIAGGGTDFIINLTDNASMDINEDFCGGEDNDMEETTTWTLNMPCGDSPTLDIGGKLEMIRDGDAEGWGIINLEGGVITAEEIDSDTDNWVINICCDGMLVLDGDVTDDVEEWVLDGHIVGCPAEDCWGEISPSADIVAKYDDPCYPGKTIVWSNPIFGRVTGPRPRDGSRGDDCQPDVVELCWCPTNLTGPGILYHIFFSDDREQVEDGNLHAWIGAQTETCITTDPLCLGVTYYWRVDAVDDCNYVPGDVWQFTVCDRICVEEFETYNNVEGSPDAIWMTWKDGCGYWDGDEHIDNGTGSCVYANVENVHGGVKRMMYLYDCSGEDMSGDERDCNYAEATRALEPQDWSASCIETIEVWFYGDADNDNGPDEAMFMLISDSDSNEGIVYYGATAPEDLADMKVEEWQQWDIALADFAAQDVDLTIVDSIALGFGDRTNCHDRKGGYGLMYFDDICLFPCRCVPKYTPDVFDTNDDCRTDWLDIKNLADNWLEDRR
jgi:hypothetical protein